MTRVFHPRYLYGHRIHHGLAGMGLVAAGLGLVIHDWLLGDSPRVCIRDWRGR